MYTGDIVAIQVSQFHKDRGEHVRFGFKLLSSRLALCGRRKLIAAIQLFTILHRSEGRKSLLLAVLIFTIAGIGESRLYQPQTDRYEHKKFGFKLLSSQHAFCARRKIITAIQFFTILHRVDGRRSLLLAVQIFTIADIGESRLYQHQQDRDEQARFKFKFWSLQHALCGRRRLLTAMQFFTILHSFSSLQHALCGRGLLSAIHLVTILHTMDGRRKLLLANLYFTIADIVELRLSDFKRIATSRYGLHSSSGHYNMLCVGAGCFQPYSLSPYCRQRMGAGGRF